MTGSIWRVTTEGMADGFLLQDASDPVVGSPLASGTNEIALKWPANAVRLNVYPLDADAVLRKQQGGAEGGTAPIPQGAWFSAPGKPGDTTYIGRDEATALAFAFETRGS